MSFVQSLSFACYLILIHAGLVSYRIVTLTEKDHLLFSKSLEILTFVLFFGISSFFALVNNYIYIRSSIANFNNNALGASASARISDFVDRLIPKHSRESEGFARAIGETASNVTLLFADIVGFTEYSSSKSSIEVVKLLSRLFTSFDKECNQLNLYKVYTIGDCYVVMSFLDKNNRHSPEKECADVVELGFKMVEIISRVRKEIGFENLHMRIGIHTGDIIGGVIGTGIIRYDLYGHDVLIANKMESSGQSDMVHVSEATKEMLKRRHGSKYKFIPDKLVTIKSLHREIQTYFLEKLAN